MASDRDGTIKCTFDDCFLLFKTKKQMKMHKWKAAEHEYCRVCDLDFTDWDAHIAHKVEVDDARSDGHHICCRFCGFEFNTREARNRHVTHAHPVVQTIPCRACGIVFHKPSDLVRHLEGDLCPNFGAEDFYAQVQHKLIVKELLADPRKLAGLTGEKWANAARDDDDILGGVSIMDISDEAPLLLDSGVMVPTNADNTGGVPINKQDFPSLQDSVTDTKGKAKSKDHNSTGPLVQPNDEVTVIKDKVNTPALEDKSDYETLFYSTPTEMAGASRKSGPPTRPPNPWKAGGPSSKTMFPTAKATLADHAWIAKVKEAESNSNNMLYRQFWNPDSKDYNADRFYDPILEFYVCPIPGCFVHYPTARDITMHLYEKHRVVDISCPACRKDFKMYHQLVAHFESGSEKCGIIHSDFYERIMDDFTGGFVNTTAAARPEDSSLGYHKFEGATPIGFEERATGVQIGGQRTGIDGKMIKRRGG